MAPPLARLLTGFVIVALLLVVAALVWTITQPSVAPPPLPKPNGYDDLVRASRMLDNSTWHSAAMSEADLRVLVSKNAEALNAARAGLSRPCKVPLDCSRPIGVYINTNLPKSASEPLILTGWRSQRGLTCNQEQGGPDISGESWKRWE